jgi:hypothetical protein
MSKIEKIMDDMIKHASTAGKVKSSSANIKSEKEDEENYWVDPAGGIHYDFDDNYDPASMYE